MAGLHVKSGDNVYILTGKDRGKQGKILDVMPKDKKVIVEGINVCTKHKKARSVKQSGGIIHQEIAIDASNVMLICGNCKKPTKVGKKLLENGEKVRICKKCNEQIGVIRKQDE